MNREVELLGGPLDGTRVYMPTASVALRCPLPAVNSFEEPDPDSDGTRIAVYGWSHVSPKRAGGAS